MANKDALEWIGDVTPETRTIAEEIVEHLDAIGAELPVYGDPYNSEMMWGMGSSSEHATGRALDVMVMRPGPVGAAVWDFAWANRDRYDLTHEIYRQRIRSTEVSPGRTRKMGDRGSPTENHMDHNHLFFGGQAKVEGSPNKPRRSKTHYYKPTGEMSVKEIQRAVKVKVDGYYGVSTKAAVRDKQEDLGVPVDGLWGPNTEAAYKAEVKRGGGAQSVPSRRDPTSKKAPRFPLPRGWYFGPKSGPRYSVSGFYGHRGDLRQFQRRMKHRNWTLKADGLYGDRTATVVRQFQKEKGLTVDGLIGAETWKAAWTEPVT